MKNIDYPPTPSNENKELHEKNVAELKETITNNEEVVLETPEAREEKIAETDAMIRQALEKKDDGSESFEDNRTTQEKQVAPEELYAIKNPEKKSGNNFFKKFMVTLGLAGITTAGAAKNSIPEKPLADSTKNKTERIVSKKGTSDTATATIPLYTKSKTPEGGTTPTGFNNSFFNNEYGIKADDIEKTSKEYGFRTSSVEDYQTDIFGYLEKNYPNVIQNVKEKYGLPAAGKWVDGLAGVRLAMAISELKKNKHEVKKTVEQNPFARFSQDWEIVHAPGGSNFKNGHLRVHYPTSATLKVTEGGAITNADVLIQPANDFGPTAGGIVISDKLFKKMTAGRDHIQQQKDLDFLLSLAPTDKNELVELNAEELAKLTTASL